MSKDKAGGKSRRSRVNVISGRCKGCGFCVEFCPQRVLYQSTDINSKGYHLVAMKDSDKCTGCGICSMLCPEFAVVVFSSKEEPERKVMTENV